MIMVMTRVRIWDEKHRDGRSNVKKKSICVYCGVNCELCTLSVKRGFDILQLFQFQWLNSLREPFTIYVVYFFALLRHF